MKDNKVSVIYPAEFTMSFTLKGDCTDTLLEQVFEQWNAGSGRESDLFQNSKVRSLSVNDIVCINDQYFQCKSLGWKSVSKQYVNDLENKVKSHPDFTRYGAWFTLSRLSSVF